MQIGVGNLNSRVLWYDGSNKGIFNKIACFLVVFPLFSKIRQIFSDFWFWVGNKKLKEFYIFRGSVEANTAGVAIVMRIPFLVLVNILPSYFLLPVVFFYHKLFDKILLWRKFCEPVHFIELNRTLKRKRVNLAAG